jgi:hypothetical protein
MKTWGSFLWRLPRNIFIFLLQTYQKTLSPDHGWFKVFFPHGYCRFHPTCSQYGIEALQKYGFVKGTLKTSWRVLRCNPWNKGGEDPP